MQSDGNFVLYRSHDKTAFWETGTTWAGTRPVLSLQDDGNLVIYYQDGSRVAWSSGTDGNDGKNVQLKLQNDGNLVLYDDSIALCLLDLTSRHVQEYLIHFKSEESWKKDVG